MSDSDSDSELYIKLDPLRYKTKRRPIRPLSVGKIARPIYPSSISKIARPVYPLSMEDIDKSPGNVDLE